MNFIKTKYPDYALLILRSWLGVAIIWHSNPAFADGLEGFTAYVESLRIPGSAVLGPLAKVTELVGGIMILLGLYARWAAVLTAIVMFVAFSIGHHFIILGEGELAFNYFIASIVVTIAGSGKFSIKDFPG